MMNDDMALVREYAASQSERAFETRAARHVNLVYSAAPRQVYDSRYENLKPALLQQLGLELVPETPRR